MAAEIYRLINLILAISTPYVYLFLLFIKLYLDIMNESNKSKLYQQLNYADSTSTSVRRLLKIWDTSAVINVSEALLHASNKSLFDIWEETS